MEFTIDKILGGRVTLHQPKKGYRVAVDTPLLAAMVPAQAGDHVLDMGCGTGGLSLCLHARVKYLNISGFDINNDYLHLAKQSLADNDVVNKVRFLQGDVANPPTELIRQSFDYVISNPPFFDEKAYFSSPNAQKSTAHAMDEITPWINAAADFLKPEGQFFVIFPYNRRDYLYSALATRFSEATEIIIHPKADFEPNRVIFAAKQDKNADFLIKSTKKLILHKNEGGYTDEAEAVLRHAQAISII
jgi:tRNA1(Val) A37 N6-methylase TrmN6